MQLWHKSQLKPHVKARRWLGQQTYQKILSRIMSGIKPWSDPIFPCFTKVECRCSLWQRLIGWESGPKKALQALLRSQPISGGKISINLKIQWRT